MTTTTKRDELRERLKKSGKRKFATVEIDGDEYVIRSLSMKEKGENEIIPINMKTTSVDPSKISQQKCDLLCRSVVDGVGGEPIFETSEWLEWESVAAPIAARLLEEIEQLNSGVAVPAMVGNSEPTGD